jgi:small subunit ribosomal protein S7
VEATRFIHKLMMRGKETTAQRIFYQAMDEAKEKTGQEPLKVFTDALKNATPLLQVKPRRVGGATYQVPVEVPPQIGEALAMRWIIDAARGRKGAPMAQRLSVELMDAFKNEGTAVKKREDLRRMAEANRAFAHYRW